MKTLAAVVVLALAAAGAAQADAPPSTPSTPLVIAERALTGNPDWVDSNLSCRNGICRWANVMHDAAAPVARVTRPTPKTHPYLWLVRTGGRTCTVTGTILANGALVYHAKC